MNVVVAELLNQRLSSGPTILFFEDSSACLSRVTAMGTSYFRLIPRWG